MDTYETMLDQGFQDLPEIAVTKERFEIPLVSGHHQGNRTIVVNFQPIVKVLRRDVNHFLKFLTKEVASQAKLDGPRLVFMRKVSSSLLNTKIQKYCKSYVLCKTCGKPDTKLIEENGVESIQCSACGAVSSVGA